MTEQKALKLLANNFRDHPLGGLIQAYMDYDSVASSIDRNEDKLDVLRGAIREVEVQGEALAKLMWEELESREGEI